MKLTDDVKQRKQKHFKQYRTAKQKLTNKENLVRFLHRGKPTKQVLKQELEATKKDLRDEIEESQRLGEELDDLEQYTRKNSLEIYGVPENIYTTTEEVVLKLKP